jgi:cold shock CspA family protein
MASSSSPSSSCSSSSSTGSNNSPVVILQEMLDAAAPQFVAAVKWWADRLGYGFLTIVSPGASKGKDVFVHHTSIRPLNSRFRTLRQGEYVCLDVVHGEVGEQAANVTGVFGGPLMCDVTPSMWPARRRSSPCIPGDLPRGGDASSS